MVTMAHQNKKGRWVGGFLPILPGIETYRDFYKDDRFRACITHIITEEGAGAKNQYKDKKTGKICYYPFGLGAVGNLTHQSMMELQTHTVEEHLSVMIYVLNEYWKRYFIPSGANRINDCNIARCAFDIHMNIGNLKSFCRGVNYVMGTTKSSLIDRKEWNKNKDYPGANIQKTDYIKVASELSNEDIKKINEIPRDKISEVIKCICAFRIIHHSLTWGDWRERLDKAIGKSDKQIQNLADQLRIGGDQNAINHSLLKRSLMAADGNQLYYYSQEAINKMKMNWGLL